jgi:DNA-binding CsgD family transcriptional regulator
MEKELDKEALTRLYLKEKRSLREIATMYGLAPSTVRYRNIKYGIKLRPQAWSRKINLNKSVLKKLYVKEGRSSKEVAEMLSCSPLTVLKRCKEYGIPLRGQSIKLSKTLLQKLYVKEGKTIREIAKIQGCSFEPVRRKCKQFGIPLRKPGSKIVQIDESILRRLYVKEGKSMAEIAKAFNCVVSTVLKKVKQFGLKKEPE